MQHERCGKIDTSDAERIVGALYTRRVGQLLATARRTLGDRPSAEDVVHDAFTRLWQMVATRESPQKIEAMLFVLFRNALVDEQRRRRSRKRALMRLAGRVPTATHSVNPTARLERAESRAAAMRALRSLPPRERQILRLIRERGSSFKEIAFTLGIQAGTVRTVFARALARIVTAGNAGKAGKAGKGTAKYSVHVAAKAS